jgi:MFS family permease
MENDVANARFLTPYERIQGVERLRANQTGIGSTDLKWDQVLEVFVEPKTYLWIGMALLLNVGAAVTNTFGPLIIKGLGFDKYISSLLNMPFGAVQLLVIVISSYAAQKLSLKSPVLATIVLPVVAGLAMLYAIPRSSSTVAPLLVAYYFLGFLFGGNPLIVSWIVGNTAGTTKKSIMMSLYNAGASSGNIIGPLLFNSADAPSYHHGIRSCLAIFVTLVAVVFLQVANLMFLNKLQSKKRAYNGKQAVIQDHSMEAKYVSADAGNVTDGYHIGEAALHDVTDRKNDDFVYIY